MFRFCLFLIPLLMLSGCSESPSFSYVYKDGQSVVDLELLVQSGGIERSDLSRDFFATWQDVLVGADIDSIINMYGDPDVHVLTKYYGQGFEFDSVVLFYAVKISENEETLGEEQWVSFYFDNAGALFWAVSKNMHLPVVGDRDLRRGMYWTYR